jgi:serine/threonine-protein kinase
MAHATTADTVALRSVVCEQPSIPQPSIPQPSIPQPSIPQPSIPQPSIQQPQPSVQRLPRRRRGQPDDTLVAGSRVSSWSVERELGRGGMASVHAVVHRRIGKRAAIKIAHRSVIGESYTADTFLREARIVHAIDHPGVIDVFATGACSGRPYLVMERLVGSPLGDRVDEGPISRIEALRVLIELCDILRAAHAAGIIHRDLKLDNVFLVNEPYSRERRVKLLDWGVAYVTGEHDPFRGLIAGTLTYVAPEQIRGGALSPATDIYSLAVLAYHLLCRRPPFAAQTDLALIQLHLRAEPPRPRTAWPGVPPALDALLSDMLAKNPGDRPDLATVARVLRTTHDQLVAAEASAFDLRGSPPIDVFGRPALLVPPFRTAWIAAAIALTALAGVMSALP